MLRFRDAVKQHGDRFILKALMDTPISITVAEKLANGRYTPKKLRGTTRLILEAFLDNLEKAS